MIKICLVGLGKTGQQIAKSILEQEDLKLVAAICSPKSSRKNLDLGEVIGTGKTGIKITSSNELEDVIFKSKPDIVIDFSNPLSTMQNAKVFAQMKINMVVGTTGFTDDQIEELAKLTSRYHCGIVLAPNITLGVNVTMLLSNIAAHILNNYDFQITETHHKHKKDAPSGTAIKIANELERGLKSSGVENKLIPISAVRAGGVVGKHEVLIVGEEDKIEITHESFSRKAFALGAIRAARFIYKKVGYFEMKDVLNLKKALSDCMNSQHSLNFSEKTSYKA